ncbi:hypothetical protein [Paenibacillus assamensis]|uniref:hypothetical protein n=1 Tax=Paenibacillus assamensis TaxID=311244 RepID=UPI0004229A8C|nr:hypothetical protein [Paenibacillus assamensis]
MKRTKLWKNWIRNISAALVFVIVFLSAGQTYALNETSSLPLAYSNEILTQHNQASINKDIKDQSDIIVPNAHPIVWIGYSISKFITWVAAGTIIAHTVYIAGQQYALVTDFAAQLGQTNKKKEDLPDYYKAKIRPGKHGQLHVGDPLTQEEAISWLKQNKNNDVWATDSMEAFYLASQIGNGKWPVSENHAERGSVDLLYYWHYHDQDRTVGHIFYGTEFKVGQQSWTPFFLPEPVIN